MTIKVPKKNEGAQAPPTVTAAETMDLVASVEDLHASSGKLAQQVEEVKEMLVQVVTAQTVQKKQADAMEAKIDAVNGLVTGVLSAIDAFPKSMASDGVLILKELAELKGDVESIKGMRPFLQAAALTDDGKKEAADCAARRDALAAQSSGIVSCFE